jgi:prepilin-type N-terminal cleavage/methylation domain-containing protein
MKRSLLSDVRATSARLRRRGYTAVEVMMALTILLIASSGVIAMQRGAVQGNVDARRIDTANAIARTWTERLRADATLWTLPNAANPTPEWGNINSTRFLGPSSTKTIPIGNGATLGEFVLAPEDGSTPPLFSPAFDVLGRDVKSDVKELVLFCAHIRLTWLVTWELLRAEVRVIWPRNVGALAAAPDLMCKSIVISDPATTAELEKYHVISTVTSIRRNPAP